MINKTKSIAFTAPGIAEYLDWNIDIPNNDNYVLVRHYVTTISCGTERANQRPRGRH